MFGLAVVPNVSHSELISRACAGTSILLHRPKNVPLNKIVWLKIIFWPNLGLILGGFGVENLESKITDRPLFV